MSKKDGPILIVGGGIGGLTAAIALKRKGIDIRVLEAAEEYRAVGAGITIQMNAMQALREIGLSDDIHAAGNVLNRLAIRMASGKTIFEADMLAPSKRYGVPFVAIHRAKLQDALLESLGRENVTLGFRATEFTDVSEGRVRVVATDGQVAEGCAIIGADGLSSVIRKQLWGDSPLRYSGYTSWRGVVDNDGSVPEDEGGESWGARSVFGLIPFDANRLYWFATHAADPDGVDANDPRETILTSTGPWHDPIPEVVQRTSPEAILRTDIRDRPPRFPWGKGQVTLLGDAIHPMTPNLGQGGCQAIEDGVVLAHWLAKSETIETGMRSYERLRHRRTRKVVKSSRSMSQLAHGTAPTTRFARRYLFPNIPDFIRERLLRSVFEFDLD